MALDDNGNTIVETGGALDGVSQQGQDVARATGAAYKDLGKPTAPEVGPDGESLETEPPAYDPAAVTTQAGTDAKVGSALGTADGSEPGYVDAGKSTVAGQLNTLLSQDSPYIQQARLAGQKQAASRGMLNSSMAAGASQQQAIQAALPIAQQDAQTYATAQGREQTADIAQSATKLEGIVSGGLSQQNAKIKEKAQTLQNQFTAQMQGASESNKVLLNDMQNQHGKAMADLETTHQTNMSNAQISAAKAESVNAQASAIMQNYQISIETMMTDADFLNLGTEATFKSMQNAQTLAKNSLKFLGATANVPGFSTTVDRYMKTLGKVAVPKDYGEVE